VLVFPYTLFYSFLVNRTRHTMAWLISSALMKDYENSLCSQERVAESWAENSLDGEQSAPLNGPHIQQAFCSQDKMTECSRLFRFGMMFRPLTEDLGVDLLMWYLEDSRAKTSHAPEREPELMGTEAVCGNTWQESSVRFDLNTLSWKTHQCLWEEDLPESLVTLPKWGMMQGGALLEQTPPDYHITEPECGWLATPLASDVRDRGDINMPSIKRRFSIGKQVSLSALFKGAQCPSCAEIIMGWPENWSAITPLETDRFQQWQESHGIH